jgi:hypothetical protein
MGHKEKEKTGGIHRYTERQHGDLISLLTTIKEGGYADRWTDTDGNTERQHGDPISLLLFLKQ